MQSLSYTLSAAWIYILYTRMIAIYYLNIAGELQRFVERDFYCLDEIVKCFQMFKHLSHSTRLLHRRLQVILLINCYCLVTNMIYFMYYVTRYNAQGFTVSFGDWFSLIEAMCRLLFICHSADSIRNSVNTSRFCFPNSEIQECNVWITTETWKYFSSSSTKRWLQLYHEISGSNAGINNFNIMTYVSHHFYMFGTSVDSFHNRTVQLWKGRNTTRDDATIKAHHFKSKKYKKIHFKLICNQNALTFLFLNFWRR